jgi:hypothetical protein
MDSLRTWGLSAFAIALRHFRLRVERRRPSARQFMKMSDQQFERHIRATGMEAQIRRALARIRSGQA